jgi:hypothetical protein
MMGYTAKRMLTVLVFVAAAALTTLGGATPALASSAVKEEFAPFANCPVESSAVCVVATTTGGEFVLDHKTVTIDKTITLQGGLATNDTKPTPLIAPTDGETLSNTPLTVPGGLAGIEGLGGEVTATAELAGPITVSEFGFLSGREPAVTLPLKIKLGNPILGESCYIGSESEPLILHLTTGTTSPPFPAQPIAGSAGTFEGKDKNRIRTFQNTSLVDNDFSVPGATGCGALVSLLVDADVGIPASPGESKAVMNGVLEETPVEWARKYIPKKKKKK